jgi:transposase-like protein
LKISKEQLSVWKIAVSNGRGVLFKLNFQTYEETDKKQEKKLCAVVPRHLSGVQEAPEQYFCLQEELQFQGCHQNTVSTSTLT